MAAGVMSLVWVLAHRHCFSRLPNIIRRQNAKVFFRPG
ncbi:hypothetical protein EKH55_3100 [Sinorhizobium alkalisoli]|nr:hypothetical protein EKH55_3100 [Sinorhizobium alkalisoli]